MRILPDLRNASPARCETLPPPTPFFPAPGPGREQTVMRHRLWLGTLAASSLHCAPPVPRAHGPLDQSAWVWQRVWTPAVVEAVTHTTFDHLRVLAAEVEWAADAAVIHRVQTGSSLPARSTLVVRVEAVPEGVDPLPTLANLIPELLHQHPDSVGVQLDIDLPTRTLGQYAGWAKAVRPLLDGRTLEVTTLPTWMSSPQLHTLREAVDQTILQVHWLDPSDPTHLLSPKARAWVEAYAEPHLPFQVALPTCGYAVATDPSGQLVGVAAEQGTPRAPAGGAVHELVPDPAEAAALVAEWTLDRPETLQGLVWFRLPTAQDQRAWPAATLRAVREGRSPVSRARVELRPAPGSPDSPPQLWDVILHNEGETNLSIMPLQIDGSVALAEGIGAWTWSAPHRSFQPVHGAAPLPPSSERVVGWLRTASPHTGAPHVSLPAPIPH